MSISKESAQKGVIIVDDLMIEYFFRYNYIFASTQLCFRVFDSSGSLNMKIDNIRHLVPIEALTIIDHNDSIYFAIHCCTLNQITKDLGILNYPDSILQINASIPLISLIIQSQTQNST